MSIVESKNVRVLFYSDIPRSFRSTFLGYFYEIAQVFPVVLLSEKLDPVLNELLQDKKLFPKLEKIVEIGQYEKEKVTPANLVARHRYFSKLAKDLILEYRPNIVFATGANIFESYLRRFAKKIKAVSISGTGPFFLTNPKGIKTFRELLAANTESPVKILFSKLRKYAVHVFYYYLAPLFAGQKPFFLEPSVILWDVENIRGADYYFVFLKSDYDIIVKNNEALAKKLFILNHPFLGKGRKILEKINYADSKSQEIGNKVLTVMWPEISVGFKKEGFALISQEDVQKKRNEIIGFIAGILKGWTILIKPHPMVKGNPGQLEEITKNLKPISDQIQIADPSEPAEKYVEMSDAILGLAPASASLFYAFLRFPEKPILSLDLNKEFLGDAYKNLEGIEYINSKEKLVRIIELIAKGSYNKKIGSELKSEGFSSVVDALRSVLKTN